MAGAKGGRIRTALVKESYGNGGFISKIHARSDGQGRPLALILTGGEVSDYSGADSFIDIPVTTPRRFLSKKGYDSDKLRKTTDFSAILPIIPPRSNRKKHILYNLQHYKDRHHIERMFNKLKPFRRIVTGYDKTRQSFLAFLHTAAVKLWLPDFVNRTQLIAI
ncbi:IS5 family transposase [Zymomonas sp.]|uniref:IS5 family transposase n=1 Tax=Zymomonas sp. TaxID=2068624 RepID=UPI0025FD2693|nr:IS5 family transposase [Zymomonas sp.]MCA1956002.1 IS5 family transposase [Zymomonas sp.]